MSDYSAAELELGELFGSRSNITGANSAPLEVLEVAENLYGFLSKSRTVQTSGWTVTEFGSRAWLVRGPGDDNNNNNEEGSNGNNDGRKKDSGIRGWKMGASFWGMRKIPVAVAEVGGMYGSYMFKRKL